MKCLLVINNLSGNSKRVIQKSPLIDVLKARYSVIDTHIIDKNDGFYDVKRAILGYDAIAVCGGDGTLNRTLNALRGSDVEFIYFPCGTLNDTARSLKSYDGVIDVGEFNDRLFSYVTAVGSFTPIGYNSKPENKRIFKRLCYYLDAFKEYKLWHIDAEIDTDGLCTSGEFTLVMLINSKSCFGLNFNKLFSPTSGKAHLLLIRTPKGAFSLVKMFFLFFRAFFVGFRKELNGKNIIFKEVERANIRLKKPLPFCVDGELEMGKLENNFVMHKNARQIFISHE